MVFNDVSHMSKAVPDAGALNKYLLSKSINQESHYSDS